MTGRRLRAYALGRARVVRQAAAVAGAPASAGSRVGGYPFPTLFDHFYCNGVVRTSGLGAPSRRGDGVERLSRPRPAPPPNQQTGRWQRAPHALRELKFELKWILFTTYCSKALSRYRLRYYGSDRNF